MFFNCNCDNRECEYQEVKEFIEILNFQLEKDFFLKYCPDAQKCKEYNTDLEYLDENTGDALYIEVKEAHIGYFKEKENKQKGEDNGRAECALLVSQAIDYLPEEQQDELQDFIVEIPPAFISEGDKISFRDQLITDLKATHWDSQDNYSLIFNGKNGSIKIDFDRKSDETQKTFGQSEGILFALENGNAHPRILSDIFEQLMDINSLVETLAKNAKKTGKGKFPSNNACKILLNILRMPLGDEVILNTLILQGYEGILIKEIQDNKQKFASAATESYLLWYCDQYYQKVDDIPKSEAKPVLLCIPLIEGFIKEPTLFDLSETS